MNQFSQASRSRFSAPGTHYSGAATTIAVERLEPRMLFAGGGLPTVPQGNLALLANLATTQSRSTASTSQARSITLGATPAANVPKVTLVWSNPHVGQTGIVVRRSTDGIHYSPAATLSAATTTWTDTGSLRPATTYWYRVRATGGTATVNSASVRAVTANFQVFDSTVYSGKPDLSALGIQPIFTAYQTWFFDTGQDQSGAPSETATRAIARKAVALGNQILVIDIESWPVDIRTASTAAVQTSMQWFSQVIGWLRSEEPGLKIGIYGVLPLRDSHRPDLWTPQQQAAWAAANAFLSPLAAQVDYLFPSLYTFYTDPSLWLGYAQANLQQARQYGKPIIPYIWMEYHPGNTAIPPDTPVSGDIWRTELNYLRKNANGVVIWGGVNVITYASEPWDSTAPWWVQTYSFVTA